MNECVSRLENKEKLSSKNVEANLKSVIINEAVRKAKKAISDFIKGEAKSIAIFKVAWYWYKQSKLEYGAKK